MSSEVWKHFVIDSANSNFAICQVCGVKISRGGNSKTTSNMKKHLGKHKNLGLQDGKKRKVELAQNDPHTFTTSETDCASSCDETSFSVPAETDSCVSSCNKTLPPDSSEPGTSRNSEFMSLFREPKTKSPITPKPIKTQVQPTLKMMIAKTSPFRPGDPRAKTITQRIGRMICLDNQPFSLVEDRGFNDLVKFLEPKYVMPCRKHFSEKVVPDMYKERTEHVKQKLEEAQYISLTTDMWTSTNNDDYLSLTVHFVDGEFVLQHFCIEVTPFPEISHSGENICNFITQTLHDWGLGTKVVAIVRDNGRNITSALEMSDYQHLPCLAHSFQLVVKDGLLNNKIITNLTANCRRIVGHFKHSSRACKELKKAQELLNMKHHKLIQDEPTRWNSVLHMLERLFEQKQSVTLASTNLRLPVELTAADWNLMENVISMLNIFNQATLAVSTQAVTASEVIPIVNSTIQELQKPAPQGSGLQGMKNDLLASVKLRYKDAEDTQLFAAATLLDPRLKGHVFSSQESLMAAKNFLIQEATQHNCSDKKNSKVSEIHFYYFLLGAHNMCI